MATKASRIALAGSNISSTGEVDADLLDNIDSAAFLSLDSNGRLGIGTSSPARQLSIVDDGTNGQAIMELIDSTNNNLAGIFLGRANNTNIGGMRYFHSTNHLALRSNDVDALIIDSSGAVNFKSAGVVTLKASPLGSTYGAGFNVMTVTGTSGAPYTSTIGFSNYSKTNAMVIQGENVGIGTSNPNAKLDISAGTASGTMYNALVLRGGQNSTQGSGVRLIMTGTENDPLARGSIIESIMTNNGNNHSLNFYTSVASTPTKKMEIDHNGNVGIGNTPADKLDIQGADNGITVRSVQANRPVIKLVNGTSNMLQFSANNTYGAIGNGSDANKYMAFRGDDVIVGSTGANGTTDFTAKLIAGTFSTKWGAENNMAYNTWTTIFTFGNNEGNFMVSARGSGTGNINDNTTGIVHVQASSQTAYANLLAGSRCQLRMNGLALQCKQLIFTGANINWNIIRIST